MPKRKQQDQQLWRKLSFRPAVELTGFYSGVGTSPHNTRHGFHHAEIPATDAKSRRHLLSPRTGCPLRAAAGTLPALGRGSKHELWYESLALIRRLASPWMRSSPVGAKGPSTVASTKRQTTQALNLEIIFWCERVGTR